MATKSIQEMGGMTKVLVVAPRFPSINQPWIDTYLEQLLKNGFTFCVFSSNKENGPYGEKVDALGLSKHIIDFSLDTASIRSSFFKSFFRFGRLRKAFRVSNFLGGDLKSRLVVLFKALHFLDRSEALGHPSIIHSHAEHLAFDFLVLATLHNIPLMLTFHGLPPTGIGQLAPEKRRILYRHVRKVLVNTRFASGQVYGLGCPKEKVRILPQGLPLPDFPVTQERAWDRGEPLYLLSVGRFHRDKGQRYALIALKRLVDSGVRVKWRFVGVGPDLVRLRELSDLLKVGDHVEFLIGLSSSELGDIYRKSHVFVLASVTSHSGHVETQGVVLQEAQASGCIVVATETGGIPECVTHMRDAILVKERSSRAIYAAIQYLVSNPEQHQKLRDAGRRNVENSFSADFIGKCMAEELLQISS